MRPRALAALAAAVVAGILAAGAAPAQTLPAQTLPAQSPDRPSAGEPLPAPIEIVPLDPAAQPRLDAPDPFAEPPAALSPGLSDAPEEEVVRIVARSGSGAVLRGLDKVNGHVVDVEIAAGETRQVLGLDVALGDCRYPADNPGGDAYAYLTIWETGKNDQLFDGWMIASSPALNALDHRRFDIWVLRCITSAAEGSGGETKSAD